MQIYIYIYDGEKIYQIITFDIYFHTINKQTKKETKKYIYIREIFTYRKDKEKEI